MTALPGVAVTLFAARNGIRSVPLLLAIALAATGALGMLAFWAYYADRTTGQSFSYFVLFGSILLAAVSLRGGGLDRRLLRQLATPLALWALGSAFLVFLGFLHGGADKPIEMASVRFSSQLPSDNDIPHYFTEWFYAHGHHGHPLYPPDWLASDRPPLQIGYLLAQRPFAFFGEGLNYQVLGVVLQQLWIVGLWALLVAARVGRLTRALALIAVLLSDLTILNGFYVWPKLLPAAMLLAAAALVLTPLWRDLRRRPWAGLLVGALLALAMLGHGSSLFGAIPIAIVAAFRGLPSWRWLGAALLAAVVLMAPWSAYQKYAEPPANRLAKWAFAGLVEIDPRGTAESVVDAYREAGVGGTLRNKAENFLTMGGVTPSLGSVNWWANPEPGSGLTKTIKGIRKVFFFDFFPSLGLLLIAPFVMLAARRRGRERPEEWNFAVTCWIVVLSGCFVWGLLMFGNLPARAVIHVGSYALPILAFCGAVAGLRATFPRFANYWIVAGSLLMLALYVPSFDPLPGTGYSWLSAVLAALGLAGFAAVAFAHDPDPDSAPEPAPPREGRADLAAAYR
ncbi:MAG: hypothetical protein ACTHK6_06330 [Solirubrobacterales bacterium]